MKNLSQLIILKSKTYKFISILLFIYGLTLTQSYGLGISGPSTGCPGIVYNYTYSLIPTCENLKWEVYENGVKKTSGWSVSGNTLSVTWSNVGTGQVKVREEKCCVIPNTCPPNNKVPHLPWKTKNIAIGIGDPSPISGSNLICNIQKKNYSIDPVPNATSYTWEVPNSNWKVDNTPGPVVHGLTDSEDITGPGSSGSGDKIIKVKAVSSTCGSSSYSSKTIRYGVPDNAKLNIRQDYGMDDGYLCVDEGNQLFAEYSGIDYSYISEYSWSLPPGWVTYYTTSDGI